jgi:hypothetical protein
VDEAEDKSVGWSPVVYSHKKAQNAQRSKLNALAQSDSYVIFVLLCG